ncbi:MAG: hypothetical protein Q8O19_01210, partial [Rectinemataceae bacterium]|nr:hypothetical protein [Rectinemataceae bacterium]
WWVQLKETSEGRESVWSQILDVAKRIELFDAEVQQDANVRVSLRLERTRLQEFENLVVAQRTKRSQIEKQIGEAKTCTANFDTENRLLVAEVEKESSQIAINKEIKIAYDEYLSAIKLYRDALPGTLVADLNETAMSLYNGFNREDLPSDKLAELKLPLTVDDHIEVTFAGSPNKSMNALHVLSEGHIRCLGLAILLAKNIKLGCPFLLFDDAVNAIDDDHRSGIKHTLFEDSLLAGKQIILTCHGEEFIKGIKNMLGAEIVKNDCRFYVFLPHEGDNVIRVDSTPISRNYILSAREKFDRGEIRSALAEGRRAMENINHRAWVWLTKRNHGEVKLTFKNPKTPFEARDLADQLRKRINQPTFMHEHKPLLLEGFNALLGEQEWACLNGATHENSEAEEFDRSTVRKVLEGLESLDRVLTTRP